jgi:DNA-binding response OmpR family regulator
MANLLCLSENPKRVEKILSFLETQGHACHVAGTEKAAATFIRIRPPDILFVDAASTALMETAVAARVIENVPVVMLVPPERLEAFELPPEATDFLVTSCPPGEVRARIRFILRRSHKPEGGKPIAIGNILIDPERYVVTVDGVPVALTLKEFELLRYLAENRGRVFTRETLLKQIWSYDYFGGARTVDVHVRRLRSKIETVPSEPVITTVRGVGYKIE